MLRKLLPLTATAACALAGTTAGADAAAPTLKLPSAVRVAEGEDVRVRVALPRAAAARTVVRWSLAAPADFARTKGSVTIARGRRSATLRLVTRQDARREGDERFTLKLGRRSVRVTVLDDDARAAAGTAPSTAPAAPAPVPAAPPAPTTEPAPAPAPAPVAAPPLPTVSIADLTRSEGNADAAKQPVVSLSAPSTQDVVVHFETVDGTAKGGQDYSTTSGNWTIPAGKTSVTLPLGVASDTTDEEDAEQLSIVLSAPQNATLGDATGTVTILDDDPKPTISVGDAPPRLENNVLMPFPVTLSRPSVRTITVKVSTLASGAAGGSACGLGIDYVSISALVVTFAPGQTSKTVDVAICEDNAPEMDENLKLTAFDANSWAVISDAQGTGTIQQDED